MTKALATIDQKISLFIRGDEVFVNSRIVSEVFNKSHGHVLRDIDGLIEQGVSGFGETPYYEPQNGQTYRSFDMNRDAFSILAMGFTGARAMKWKMDFVRAFNAMEGELKARAPAFDPNDPVTLRQTLIGYTERVIALTATVEAQKNEIAVAAPKARFYDDFADTNGLIILTDIGRVLGVGPIVMLRHLVEKGVLFRTAKGAPLRASADCLKRGWFETKTTVVGDVTRVQTYATPRGLQGIAEMLGRPVDLFGRTALSRSLPITQH